MNTSKKCSDLWTSVLEDADSRYQPFARHWFEAKQNGWSLASFLNEHDEEGLVVFGFAALGRLLCEELELLGVKPAYIVENRVELAGGCYKGAFLIETELLWCKPGIKKVIVTPIFAWPAIQKEIREHNHQLTSFCLADLIPGAHRHLR